MSVQEPCILPWSPAGLASSVNHTGGFGIDMTLIKLGGRENQDSPAVWLGSYYVIFLLSAVHWGANFLQLSSPLAWSICPAYLHCPWLTLGQQARWWGEGRGGSKGQYSHRAHHAFNAGIRISQQSTQSGRVVTCFYFPLSLTWMVLLLDISNWVRGREQHSFSSATVPGLSSIAGSECWPAAASLQSSA